MPPFATRIPHPTPIHDCTLVDDYFWLRDKDRPEVRAYLEAENAYTEAVMQPTRPLQDTLYAEMLGRIKQTDLSVPARLGDYLYYSRTQEGQQYPYMCRRHRGDDAAEEVLLDLNALAQGYAYLSVGAYVVSDDQRWLAYSLDTTGYRQYVLQVKDLLTGEVLDDRIERVGAVVWASDNQTLFYTTEDAVSKRSNQVWRHVLAAPDSALVFEEPDELYDVSAGRSLDKQMLFIGSFARTSSEQRFLPSADPTGEFRIIVPRTPGHEYDADHYQGQLYIRTNQGASNFRIVTAPLDDPSEPNWTPFIEHDPAVKIDGMVFFARHAVIPEREGGLPALRVIEMSTGAAHRIATDEPDYTLALAPNPEFDTDIVRYTYQSMVTPSSVYDYQMDARERTLLKQQEVLGGYDPAQYQAERIWATARDGTRVPISLVSRRGGVRDGSAPMVLYGYGSYGISLSPIFSSSRLSLLDRGIVYAVAYVRGGGELGEEWRQQGRMMQKMNTFTDFIDCAEHVVREGYTSSDRLASQGGSAGGLLVCAVANLRPSLFRAVVAQVPFVDIMNTMLDASLPLTTSEYIEWGNPNERAAFDYMLTYSPYDNVTAQDYPAMLVHVSLNDSQVPYWEGAKLVAKLRVMKTNDTTLLLKSNLGAGHGGASGRYDALRETAFTSTFILRELGRAGTGDPQPTA
ncbi:MAG: S9 family peptidase [Vicinamibacterales bacterium]